MKRKAVVSGICILLALFLLLSVVAPLTLAEQSQPDTPEAASDISSGSGLKEEFLDESKERNVNLSGQAGGVWLDPAADLFAGGPADANAVQTAIGQLLDQCLAMQLNTIFFDTKMESGYLFDLEGYPKADPMQSLGDPSFDPTAYLISAAREKGLYVVAVWDLLAITHEGATANPDYLNTDVINLCAKNAAAFAQKYKPDGMLLTNYYNTDTGYSYTGYIENGGGIGLANYMRETSYGLIDTAAYAIKRADYTVGIGLLCDPVWKNDQAGENGSKTAADFEMDKAAYLDIPRFAAQKTVDFVTVRAEGALGDKKIPFEEVARWWTSMTSANGLMCYLMHANDQLGTKGGFSSPDQVLRQIIEAKKNTGYSGSVFRSYAALLRNPQGSTDILAKYLKEEIGGELLLKDLRMTRPAKLEFVTYDQTVMFTGTCDPNFPLTINGEQAGADAKTGNFSVSFALKSGLNTFTFTHKSKEVTYRITQKMKVLQSIAPTDAVTGPGGTKISVTAMAYDGAKVWAVIGGQTISLEKRASGDNDEEQRESDYKEYHAYYTLPESGAKEQNLGVIQVYASYGGFQDSLKGGSIKVSALPPEPEVPPAPNVSTVAPPDTSGSDESIPPFDPVSPPSGKLLQITAKEAETFPTTVLDDDSVPANYPYPQGAYDYVSGDVVKYSLNGVVYTYYNLKSGRRVYVKDVALRDDPELVQVSANNYITSIRIADHGKYTDIRIAMHYKTPPILSLSPVSFTGDYTVSSFSPTSLTIDLPYVRSGPSGASFGSNSMFASSTLGRAKIGSVDGYRLTLTFKNGKAFSGASSFFDDNGDLVVRVRTPMKPTASSNQFGSSLAGVRIVLSAGHGGADPGALGFNGVNEKELNLGIQEKLAAYLKEAGAEVVVLPHNIPGQNISLQQRMINAKNAKPDLFLNIHHNSAAAVNATGVETYYFAPFSQPLAKAINNELASFYSSSMYGDGSGKYNRGDKFSWRYVTREMTFPAVLIEYGFVNNRVEFDKLVQPSNQDGLAKATVRGIIKYLQSM